LYRRFDLSDLGFKSKGWKGDDLEWLEGIDLINVTEEDERSKYVSLTPKGMETYKTLVK
jgi:hypothetical protein